MYIMADGKQYNEVRQDFMPVRIVASENVSELEKLTVIKPASVLFRRNDLSAVWEKPGAWVLLDFGRELAGGVRMVVRSAEGTDPKWRIMFGESVAEAMAGAGEHGSTNGHSPRDMVVPASGMSDLTYGQTGFRFVRVELISGERATVQNIFAASILPAFDREATIKTNDSLLNDIIDTATHTLKLSCQHGVIWDGVKRDRLVWCGDLNPEVVSGSYMFGNPVHIPNSLDVLREYTEETEWVNLIPSYSAWYVINLCDYCRMTGNWAYFAECRDYALAQFKHILKCINDDGTITIPDGRGLDYFLDWSTQDYEERWIGMACAWRLAAMKFNEVEEHELANEVLRKLETVIDRESTLKPIRAFQVLAGRQNADDAAMLDKNGSEGFSTFMAYYILKAMAEAGCTDMLDLLKEYYGGMLSVGATSFWEDFDITWLADNPSGLADIPTDDRKNIHRDYGKHCYTQLRHSLCHGWSSGVLGFVIEYILGVEIADGAKTVTVRPNLCGLTDIEAKLPIATGWLEITVRDGKVDVKAPAETNVIR
ncbi:MAG: hypothetical protein IJC17_06340 [Clostridia bacterium]|nr:hypothetical protein [Clostridia bacterium]